MLPGLRTKASSPTGTETDVATLDLVLPGDPETLTGGYVYDKRIVRGLAAHGWQVAVHRLDDSFPVPSDAALRHARAVFAAIPDGRLVVVDGLALGGLPALLQAEARRLRLVALIHHPLAAETGLEADTARALHEAERAALAAVRRVVVTSRWTSRALADYDVPAARIRVVEPGTQAAPPAQGSGGASMHLLCVATLVPRKGHAILFDALAMLGDRHWHLTCAGSHCRDPDTAAGLVRQIARLQLDAHISLLGEVGAQTLAHCYAHADLFVLASYMEGYGMALAEAVARGLPVVSTPVGAIPETVPEGAGLFVPPGDSRALAQVLARVMDEPALARRLAANAMRARERLPTWDDACTSFAHALEGL
jgi:glycosyltransferase involved in cell wall biosynthesis